MSAELLLCDGCGQAASPEHLTRRFRRLEWTTRFRPIHIDTVFLSGISPVRDEEFLYGGVDRRFAGEGLALLNAVGIGVEGKSPEAVLAEFQRRGYFLTHVLECPVESGNEEATAALVSGRLPEVITRLKRSLKAKRVALISGALRPHAKQLAEAELGASILLDDGAPFEMTRDVNAKGNANLRSSL